MPENQSITLGIEGAGGSPYDEAVIEKKIVIDEGGMTTSGINKI